MQKDELMRKLPVVTAGLVVSSLVLASCSVLGAPKSEFCQKVDHMWAVIDSFDKDKSDRYPLNDWFSQVEDTLPYEAMESFEKLGYDELRLFDGDRESLASLVVNAYEFAQAVREVGDAVPEEGEEYYEPIRDSIELSAELMEWADEILAEGPPKEFTPEEFEPPKKLQRQIEEFNRQNLREESSTNWLPFYLYVARTCPRS